MLSLLFIYYFSHSNSVLADSLSDLKNKLSSLQGKSHISALVESSFTEKRGKRKSLKDSDENAPTPTLNAVNDIGVEEINNMLSGAPNLLRFINKAKYLNEEMVTFNNNEVRQLNFELSLEAIIENKEIHEYVDDFEGTYHIKIDDRGTPIESIMNFKGSGSAYIFFSLQMSKTDTSTFRLVNDRLVTINKTYQMKRSSTWGDTESSGYKQLVPNPSSSVPSLFHVL